MDLSGRVALVTGASSGLGMVLCEKFEEAGAKVCKAVRSDCDASLSREIHKYVQYAADTFGKIDILVNNAAILGPVGNVEDNEWDQWKKTIETNLFGPVCFTRNFLNLRMDGKQRAKIINLVGGGFSTPLPRRSAYASSKAALARFTESVAEEVKDRSIDVNAVAPGPMATRMLDDILACGPEKLGEDVFEEHKRIKAEAVSPDKAAELILWLASSKSDGLSGKILSARYDPWPFTKSEISEIMQSDIYTLRRINNGH